MPQYVFINGDRHELLDDRRCAMYPRYPEGTELYDPSTTPPALVPLSHEQEDFGVSVRKLIPWASYFARSPDGTPVGISPRFLIIHNLPSVLTARDLGQFFEQYSQVIEADILRWPGGGVGNSKCRGYVLLQNHDAAMLLIKEKTIYYEPADTVLFIEPSDRHPAQNPPPYQPTGPGVGSAHGHASTGGHYSPIPPPPPPQYDAHHPNSLGLNDNGTPTSQHPQTFPHGGHHGGHHHTNGLSSSRAPPHYEHRRGPTGNSELANMYYFVDRIREEDAALSVREGVFWPSQANRREYLAVAQRGSVYICFLLASSARNDPYLFGYARLVWPQRDRPHEMSVQWMKYGVQLEKRALQERLGVNVVAMSEGTPVKPELGQSIAEFIDVSPQVRVSGVGTVSPRPSPLDPRHSESGIAPIGVGSSPTHAHSAGVTNGSSRGSERRPPRPKKTPFASGPPTAPAGGAPVAMDFPGLPS